VFLEEKIQDYVSENHHEEELRLKKELRKRKLAMISLGSVYVMLILASFTLLT
jgi:amino acid permease